MDTKYLRPKLNHLPLEGYQARYTEMLASWEQRAFGQQFNVQRILPSQTQTAMAITTGEVLDSVNRPVWAMQQVCELLKQAPVLGPVWFSDFFHPGLEALPYSRASYRAFSFCWAQSFDKYDFTTQFMSWMRPWEIMAFSIYEKVFVACPLLKELIATAIPEVEHRIEVVGLPFNSHDVFKRLGRVAEVREIDCIYSSRFDKEKNPNFFLDLVESDDQGLKFAICTGHPQLKGTDSAAVRRANTLAQKGKLRIYENCTKEQYYQALSSAKVQINTAKQDWVSFTLLEALTFGCMPLYPNFRAFPETLFYNQDHLYNPEELGSAQVKLMTLLDSPPNERQFQDYRTSILNLHDGTLDRIAASIAA
jgi:hypothetical protein